MDPEETASLCASLSLKSQDEKLWSVRDSLKDSTGKKLGLCLVGKVLSTKHINREAFRAVIPRNWQTTLDIEVLIGELVEIDIRVIGECFGKYMRLNMAIDVLKPLKRFLRLELETGKESILLLWYERLRNIVSIVVYLVTLIGSVVYGRRLLGEGMWILSFIHG
ncbi:hypothetical protein Ddye_000142 [Dipteronia dyeriana]|uniref:Uncharacterized protein n=1 Tax=Dipteronia dyeriana TaxID=168575 RepID=A0AAD9XMD1_9ROSI|nr:hypothetical protein Ddye_000142 [Dipteronia dyeriana]